MTNLDPITLTVIQSGLQQVCNEMDLAFVRSAFSPVISEALDRSDGIYDKDNGELISQGELGLPVFVGTMQFGTQCVIERAKDLQAGDVYIVNDPYLGGTHLMDVRFVKPFFYKGKLFAWLANTGHWPDTGGAVPGGFSANATEVEQEVVQNHDEHTIFAHKALRSWLNGEDALESAHTKLVELMREENEAHAAEVMGHWFWMCLLL